MDQPLCCTPCPPLDPVHAAVVATSIYPVNAPAAAWSVQPARLAMLTTKYWGPTQRVLSVSFVEAVSPALADRILLHLNAWHVGVSFRRTPVGDVRITLAGGGHWSYVGTDLRLVPAGQPTMSLQGFSLTTPESEYRRVVRHEIGHTLGLEHELMRRALVARVDKAAAYRYYRRTQRWTKVMVDRQVLTPLDERSLMATPPDQTSIMCYQLPGECTLDGQPIIGGTDINATDQAFALKVYPRSI